MAAAKPLNSGYSALTILPSYNSTLCPRTIIAKIIANFTLFYKFYVCTFSALLYVRYQVAFDNFQWNEYDKKTENNRVFGEATILLNLKCLV